jgi:hypothetical protein
VLLSEPRRQPSSLIATNPSRRSGQAHTRHRCLVLAYETAPYRIPGARFARSGYPFQASSLAADLDPVKSESTVGDSDKFVEGSGDGPIGAGRPR